MTLPAIRNRDISVKEAANFFNYTSKAYPEGSKESPIPININGTDILVYFFPLEPGVISFVFGSIIDNVSFGLFLPEKRYAIKELFVASNGSIAENISGKLADIDKADKEPDFSNISNAEIINIVWETIKTQKV